MAAEKDENPYLDQKLDWLINYQRMRKAAKEKFPLSEPPTEIQVKELGAITHDLILIAAAIEYIVRQN